jgi:hypothetical protein
MGEVGKSWTVVSLRFVLVSDFWALWVYQLIRPNFKLRLRISFLVPGSRYPFWRVLVRLFIPILPPRFQIIGLLKAVVVKYLSSAFLVNYFIIQVGNILLDSPYT